MIVTSFACGLAPPLVWSVTKYPISPSRRSFRRFSGRRVQYHVALLQRRQERLAKIETRRESLGSNVSSRSHFSVHTFVQGFLQQSTRHPVVQIPSAASGPHDRDRLVYSCAHVRMWRSLFDVYLVDTKQLW